MSKLGDAIRALRMRSPYRDIRSFAEQAGLSHEGLRKIETGDRVPAEGSIRKIVTAVELNRQEAIALLVARDLDHAAREGLLDRSVTDKKIKELAAKTFVVVETYLAEFEMGLDTKDANDLRQKLFVAIEEELRGPIALH